MRRRCCVPPWLPAACLTVLLLCCAAPAVLAYCGGAHTHAADEALRLMGGMDWAYRSPDVIERDPQIALFPQLNQGSLWFIDFEANRDESDGTDDYLIDENDMEEDVESRPNYDWVSWNSMKADDWIHTVNHFWELEDGLFDHPEGWPTEANAWQGYAKDLWGNAVSEWWAGNDGNAFANLGYVLHLVQDMGQPAHTNSDLHPVEDSLEEWFSQERAHLLLQWDGKLSQVYPGTPLVSPSEILYPIMDNYAIWSAIAAQGSWYDEMIEDPEDPDDGDPPLNDWQSPYNWQQLFYLMCVVNDTANYFASDGEDGNTDDTFGWLQGFPGFPTHLHDPDGNEVSPQNQDGLSDNEVGCPIDNPDCTDAQCNCDGDLRTIAKWGYGASFRVAPAVIDLFRRTVDPIPPVTTVEVSRVDSQELKEWNNVPVTVVLAGATDTGLPGMRAAGVWKLWGLCEAVPPSIADDPEQTRYWAINQEGENHVELLSTDWCGNVETDANDFSIKIDMTPPDITFPALRPNYLTSEDFTATWAAADELSGVASEVAYLDNVAVTKGQVFDLALMAGLHTLRVIAYDNADNWRDIEYYFEVFIDAEGWARPIWLNDRTNGSALLTAVEFPAPYDVGLIDVATGRLAVCGTLDLTQVNPIVGATALLVADRITGVGDSDGDHLRDRMLRFDKEQFVGALGGITGDVPAVVIGGLLPEGMPRFLAVLTVPVFTAPSHY